jgi:hypothetical protein
MNTNGATGYGPSAFQIDGATQTVNWQNGLAPTGGSPNSIDVWTFTIIKTGSAAYKTLASVSKF